VNLAMTRLYGRAPKGERVVGTVPQNYGQNVTILGALGAPGLQAVMMVEGAMVQTWHRSPPNRKQGLRTPKRGEATHIHTHTNSRPLGKRRKNTGHGLKMGSVTSPSRPPLLPGSCSWRTSLAVSTTCSVTKSTSARSGVRSPFATSGAPWNASSRDLRIHGDAETLGVILGPAWRQNRPVALSCDYAHVDPTTSQLL
jgi:hypothetical protein